MKKIKFLLFIFLLIPLKVNGYTASPVDITVMNIEDLNKALDRGYLTSEILVNLYLERIEEYNKDFNAINMVNDKAIDEAKELDRLRSEGISKGPLHGIPILVKNNIDVEGIPTTGGNKSLNDNYPTDAEVIQKLKDKGAIILGSTNMSEFAFSAKNSYSSYGHVRNAFNLAYTPYGSSGGSAVAVTIAFGAAALGTDTNSSVRVPASAAGLVGLRPTLGLISSDGVIPYDLERDTVGIISRTVKDNALVLEAITDEKYLEEAFNINDINIGVIESYVNGSNAKSGVNSKTDADIASLANDKIKLLEDNGASIIYIDELLNNYYLNIANETVTGGSFCDGFNDYIANKKSSIKNFDDLVSSRYNVYDLEEYLGGCNKKWAGDLKKNNNLKDEFEEHVLKVMNENGVDILVYPTIKVKNLTLNSNNSLNAPGSFLGSVIGYPSITVPMGFIDEFAYGLEFFSTKDSEEMLYNIASFFENINNLEPVSSRLAPNLYEIPSSVSELLDIFNRYYDNKKFKNLVSNAKEYFKSYSDNSLEDNEIKASELLSSFKRLELVQYRDNFIYVILIIIGISGLIYLSVNIRRKIVHIVGK
ncbi:MAG: amidase [Ruminococcus sp.]|nr:amidase [Ruminococcus sp.]